MLLPPGLTQARLTPLRGPAVETKDEVGSSGDAVITSCDMASTCKSQCLLPILHFWSRAPASEALFLYDYAVVPQRVSLKQLHGSTPMIGHGTIGRA